METVLVYKVKQSLSPATVSRRIGGGLIWRIASTITEQTRIDTKPAFDPGRLQ